MSSSDEEYDPNVDDNDISDSEDSEYESEDDIDVSYDPVMDKGWSVMPAHLVIQWIANGL